MDELGKLQDQINRMQQLRDNLDKVATHVLDRIKILNDMLQKREDERVKYDHYRNKMGKMEKEGENVSNDYDK